MTHEIKYSDIAKDPHYRTIIASDSSSLKKLYVITNVITNTVAYVVTVGSPDNTNYHTFMYPMLLLAIAKYNDI